MDLRACGTGSKTPGGIPASSKAKLTVLLKKEGFTVSSSTVGRILKSLKTRGLLRERNQKPTGESETPSHEKTQRLRGGISRDLVAIDTSGVVPFLRRVYREFLPKTLSCGGPLPPSICKPRNLPRVFLEELRKVPPFPLKPGGTGGSEFYGEFEGPRRNTVSSSSSFLQDLPNSMEWWNGSIGPSGRVLSALRGGGGS